MLLLLLILALLVEALVEGLALLKDKEGLNWQMITAFTIGVLLALVFGVDLVSLAGLEYAAFIPPYIAIAVSALVTGAVVMRGSGFVHDLLGTINQLRE